MHSQETRSGNDDYFHEHSTERAREVRSGSCGSAISLHSGSNGLLPASATAVKMAARLAKEFHAKLYVLHAVMPELYGVGTPGAVPELAPVDLQVAGENLHKYAEHIGELRTVAHKEIVFLGSPADGIRSAGESHDIDLLVLGSHGRKGLAKLTLGSVAEWAIGRLHYPVLVAGPTCDKTFRPMRSIVLGTDLTEQASRPAQYAACIAKDYQARLTIQCAPDREHGETRSGCKVDHKRKT